MRRRMLGAPRSIGIFCIGVRYDCVDTILRRKVMPAPGSIVAIVLAVTVCATICSGARAFDEARYPNWRGQWSAPLAYQFGTNPSWDQTKAQGLAQQAPLTP